MTQDQKAIIQMAMLLCKEERYDNADPSAAELERESAADELRLQLGRLATLLESPHLQTEEEELLLREWFEGFRPQFASKGAKLALKVAEELYDGLGEAHRASFVLEHLSKVILNELKDSIRFADPDKLLG